VTPAARLWRDALAAWGVPDDLVAAAGASPWSLAPEVFADRVRRAVSRASPADLAARDSLPRRGTVLDVGCGAGAATTAIGPAVRSAHGVDERQPMLDAFSRLVAARPDGLRGLLRRPTKVTTTLGVWPLVADRVPPADVVVCHDVVYNVADLAPFVAALTDHARAAVVVVLGERHPLAWTTPYIEALHGLQRPTNPTADHAADVVRSTGPRPGVLRWSEPTRWAEVDRHDPDLVAEVSRRCVVPPARAADVRAALDRIPPPTVRRMVGLVWPGTAV
jgi:SAM-dependent methyltransferase